MATFSNIVAFSDATNPTNLTYSLSAENNSFVIVEESRDPNVDIIGVLYNYIPTAGEATEEISIPYAPYGDGDLVIVVSVDYDGAEAALLFKDGSTIPFTIDIEEAVAETGSPTFDNRGPDQVRKRLLGYI